VLKSGSGGGGDAMEFWLEADSHDFWVLVNGCFSWFRYPVVLPGSGPVFFRPHGSKNPENARPNKNKDFWCNGTNAEQPLTRHTHVEVLSAPFQNFLQAPHHHSCVTIFHQTIGLHQNRARTNGL